MENNYCAIVRTCVQVSPDDWEMVTATLELKENTTVKQITDWYKAQYPREHRTHIIISDLQKPKP